MTALSTDDLDALESASEITIATLQPDGSARRPPAIWVVRVADEVFKRSHRGPDRSWFDHVTGHPYVQVGGRLPSTSRPGRHHGRRRRRHAYRAKYGHGRYAAAMNTPAAAATTPQLEPSDRL